MCCEFFSAIFVSSIVCTWWVVVVVVVVVKVSRVCGLKNGRKKEVSKSFFLELDMSFKVSVCCFSVTFL